MNPQWRIFAVLVLLIGIISLTVYKLSESTPPPITPPVVLGHEEIIPPGIIVTESSPLGPPPAADSAPGDPLLGDYGNPELPAKNDLVLMAHTISNFLLIEKQATTLPLSANEEWSAALRGKRPGTELWLKDRSPAFDSERRLIDRWGTPLFFHALGAKQWELRSAGLDKKLWTADDLTEKFSG
jgi:hypothetical protein